MNHRNDLMIQKEERGFLSFYFSKILKKQKNLIKIFISIQNVFATIVQLLHNIKKW